MGKKPNYNRTIIAAYLGYISSAAANNFAPLLFLTFRSSYGIALDKIAFLVTLNFGVQLTVDLLSAKFIDRIGYKRGVVGAQILTALGLAALAILPGRMETPYHGLLLAVFIYAVGGGLNEVLISPIVEGCPTKHKEAAMSLLHSFYCWGYVFVVLSSTAFFAVFGIEKWPVLALLWAAFPLADALLFATAPILPPVSAAESLSIRGLLKQKIFWVLLLLMLCSGAAEQSMCQWSSAFAEAALGVSKTIGDLTGTCAFAFCMGLSRAFYAKYSNKIRLERFMSISGVLCVVSYLLATLFENPVPGLLGCALCGVAVGIFWPGSLSLAAKKVPTGGTALFALMALAGDMGCMTGPTMTGVVSEACGGNLKAGLLPAIVFPIVLLLCIFLLTKDKTTQKSSPIA